MQAIRYPRFLKICCIFSCLVLFFTITKNFFKMKTYDIGRSSLKENRAAKNFWNMTPDFDFYVRLTSKPRFSQEYKRVLIRFMKMFVPKQAAHLVVVLDKEKPKDREFGGRIKEEWPYPKICYMERGSPHTYYGLGKVRMYWDMMYADQCTNATYVGFLDTDTLFHTLITPQILFEGRKSVIIGKIGEEKPGFGCWVSSTARFLGRKQVMNCMTAFPVMVKTAHLRGMRRDLSKQFGKHFDQVFQESCIQKHDCLSQFSMICNYLWYYHRSEYSWHLQVVPDGYWNGKKIIEGQVDPSYYKSEIQPSMTIPMPRTSIHLRYTIVNGKFYAYKYPDEDAISDIIQEGLCYSAGFHYCPEACRKWNRNNVQHYLSSFEYDNWFWDKRCIEKQSEHYKNVMEIAKYHFHHGLEIFGVSSVHEFCYLVEHLKF